MAILNHKTKPPTGQEHAIKEHERRKKEFIEISKQTVREALGDNYPQLKRR